MDWAGIMAIGEYISGRELPPALSSVGERVRPEAVFAHLTLTELETPAILDALDAAGGNKSEAARRLASPERPCTQNWKYGE